MKKRLVSLLLLQQDNFSKGECIESRGKKINFASQNRHVLGLWWRDASSRAKIVPLGSLKETE